MARPDQTASIFSKIYWQYTTKNKKNHQGAVLRINDEYLAIASKTDLFKDGEFYTLQLTFEKMHFTAELKTKVSIDETLFIPSDANSKKTIASIVTAVRKQEHIDLCAKQDVESSDKFTGFDQLNFIPSSLPLNRPPNTNRKFLNREFNLPLFITGMTGGIAQAKSINENLAFAASTLNIPMGIGSQRIALEDSNYKEIFTLKDRYPQLFLIGNLGFSQLQKDDYLELAEEAVKMIDADGLAIHLNLLQENVQSEGSFQFIDILERLKTLSTELSTPLLIKEVGSGISIENIQQLSTCNIASIDLGGRGGTSWGYIEGLRSKDSKTAQLGKVFRNWGIPTAFNLAHAVNKFPFECFTATGGIRNGLQVAKAIALGAQMVGIGLPLFKKALESKEAVVDILEQFQLELNTTMIATGSQSLEDLSQSLCLGKPYEQQFLQCFTPQGQLKSLFEPE